MTKEQQQLVEFHKQFECLINPWPCFLLNPKYKTLRYNLIDEELKEFNDATNIYEVADALGDLLYVVLGAAVTYGIDLEPVFQEIHRSNMTKLWTGQEADDVTLEFRSKHNAICIDDNAAIRGERCFLVKRISDGKVIKSPSYSPANIKAIIDAQMK